MKDYFEIMEKVGDYALTVVLGIILFLAITPMIILTSPIVVPIWLYKKWKDITP